jgi:diguanylate cyclase (GGDEF)-like protein/PAS domain S-box-containing protein
MSWTGKLVTLALIAGMFLITGWARVQADHIDIMAVTSEMRSASIQLTDRVEQVINRAEQVTLLAAQAEHAYAARDLVLDGEACSEVVLTDRNGRVTDSTMLAVGASIAGADYFEAVRTVNSDEMHIGLPVVMVPGGDPMVPMVRATRDAAGRFVGAVVLAVRAGHFTETQNLPRRPQTVFAVVDRAGHTIAASVDGHNDPLPSLTPALWTEVRRTAATTKNLPVLKGLFDHEPRLAILRPVSARGVQTLIAVQRKTAAGTTQRVFNVIYVVVGLLSVSILGTSTFMHRQTARLRHALETRYQAESALRDEKNFFSTTLGSIEDGVITLDSQKHITYCNRRVEALTGLPAEQLLGRHVFEAIQLLPRDTAEPMREAVHALWAKSQGSAQLISSTGEPVPVEFTLTDLAQPHAGSSAVLVLHDVSKATQMAATLSYQASHDALTGLLNRAAFDTKLQAALDSAVSSGSRHVLLFLDLDQFKVVNDTCGHAAGDELLKQVGFLFGQVLRQHDTLARTGGDEFAVLLEDCPVEKALPVADKLRAQLASFRFAWKDKSFQVGVTIGAVAVTSTSGSLEDLKRKADTACYIAKDEGRGRTHLYLDSDEAVLARQGELSWATRLQKALTNGDFQLYGQRIASMRGDDACHYYEMLIRLQEADGTLVPPMAFLPAAERYGLMPVLDRAVIERALQMHCELQAASRIPVKLAINLSGASLSDPSLFEFIRGALKRYAVPAQRICFEVTETMAIANLSVAVKLMTALKELGCTLALDDFGSGMSSFSYLKQLPVDVVKIDGSFVRNLLADPVDRAMVEAVNNIAHQMGLTTLAEYAETPEVVAELKRLGVDQVQGYAVARPQSFTEMLASQRDGVPA